MQATKSKALYQYECIHDTINTVAFASGDQHFRALRNQLATAELDLDSAIYDKLVGKPLDNLKEFVFSLEMAMNTFRAEVTLFEATQTILIELVSSTFDETSQAYQFIFNQSPIGIFTYNNKFVIEQCNHRFVQILESSHEKIVGLDMKTLQFKKILPVLEKAIYGKTGYYEGPYQTTTSKAKIHVKLATSPLTNKNNQIIGGIGIVEDMTPLIVSHDELKEKSIEVTTTAEELRASNEELMAVNDALKQNQEQLQLVLDSTNDGFWDWNAETQELFFSEQFYRMLDYEPNAFPANVDFWLSTMHHKDRKRVKQAIESFQNKAEDYFRVEFRAKAKGGEWRWLLARGKASKRDSKGKALRITGTNQDITLQKIYEQELKEQRSKYEQLSEKYREQNERLEEALSELTANFRHIEKLNAQITLNEQRYRILTENIGEGIIIADKQENITYCNAIAERIFDEAPGNLTGENLARFISPDAFATIQAKTRNRQNRGIDSYELSITTTKGNQKHILVTASPHYNEFGNFNSTIGIIHDITQRKQMEEQIEQERNRAQESDRLKSIFLQNISHEIRTPMNAIIGFSDLLNTPKIDQEKKEGYIKAIQHSTAHLLNIINDLVDLSVLEANNVSTTTTRTSLNKLIWEVTTEAKSRLRKANKSDVNIQASVAELDKNRYIAELDKQKLLRILYIFIDNAIKFTHTGTITLRFNISIDKKPQLLTAWVEDTGIGIPKDKQKEIFAPFRQVDEGSVRKFGGNGLGLTIAKRLSEILNGEINMHSEEQIGTQISITIPVYNLKTEKVYE